MKLSKAEYEIVAYLRKNPVATIEELCQNLFYSRTSVTRYLKALKDKNIIERFGTTTNGYYVIKK